MNAHCEQRKWECDKDRAADKGNAPGRTEEWSHRKSISLGTIAFANTGVGAESLCIRHAFACNEIGACASPARKVRTQHTAVSAYHSEGEQQLGMQAAVFSFYEGTHPRHVA